MKKLVHATILAPLALFAAFTFAGCTLDSVDDTSTGTTDQATTTVRWCHPLAQQSECYHGLATDSPGPPYDWGSINANATAACGTTPNTTEGNNTGCCMYAYDQNHIYGRYCVQTIN